MPRVIHFEIHAGDPDRAVRFYSELFGWQFQKWGGPIDYYLVTTGPDGTPGINGGLIRRRGDPAAAGQGVNAYVCTVDVPDLDAYLAKVKQLQAITKRLGAPSTTRVWEATVAGDGSGAVVVGIEYPSLVAYAESTTKLSADAEWQKLMAGMDDMRTVVSRSLYRERTP